MKVQKILIINTLCDSNNSWFWKAKNYKIEIIFRDRFIPRITYARNELCWDRGQGQEMVHLVYWVGSGPNVSWFSKKKKNAVSAKGTWSINWKSCFVSLLLLWKKRKGGVTRGSQKNSQILTSPINFFLGSYWGPFPLKLEDYNASQKKVSFHGSNYWWISWNNLSHTLAWKRRTICFKWNLMSITF